MDEKREMPRALTWQEIEKISDRHLHRAVADAEKTALLYTLAYLYDPEIAGVYVSREYMRTVHALLDDPYAVKKAEDGDD